MPPVLYSEEWNATCGQMGVAQSIRDDALVNPAFFHFGYFLSIFVFVTFPLSLAVFYYVQKTTRSAYLKKRSFPVTCLFACGTACICIVGPIRDIVGRQVFPCEAMLWLRALGTCSAIAPFLLRLVFYRDQLLWARAMKIIGFQKLQDMVANENGTKPGNPQKLSRKSLFSLTFNKGTVMDSKVDDRDDKSEKQDGVASETSQSRPLSGETHSIDEEAFSKLMQKRSIRYRLLIVSGPFVPIIVTGLIFQFHFPYYLGHCTGCYEDAIFMIAIPAAVSLLIVMIMYLAYLLRESSDPLGMLLELKLMTAFGAIPGIPGILLTLIDQFIGRPYDSGVFSGDWLIILALIIIFFIMCPLPLIKAWRMKRDQAAVLNAGKVDFRSFLDNPRAQKLFAEHLVNEWAIENLRFWNQVETFRTHHGNFKSIRDANNVAVQIFDTFIRSGAVMEINLPAKVHDDVMTKIERYLAADDASFSSQSIPATFYDQAQTEIFLLMEKDSFRRFQLTNAYKEFADKNSVLDPSKGVVVVVSSAA